MCVCLLLANLSSQHQEKEATPDAELETTITTAEILAPWL